MGSGRGWSCHEGGAILPSLKEEMRWHPFPPPHCLGPVLMTAALDGTIKTWHLADIAKEHDTLTDKQIEAETELAEAAALAAIMQGEGNVDIFTEDKVKDKMMQTFRAHDNNIWDMQIRPQTTRDGDLVIATASTFNEIKFWRCKQTSGSVQNGDVFYDFGTPVQDYVGHGGPGRVAPRI